MKKFCFCFQIHIPIITTNYRFFDIGENHQYFNDEQIRERVKKINSEILLPLIDMLKETHIETYGSFKTGISISGTTLTLLQRIAPDTIVKLLELTQNNCIEFLSEPWSFSIVPFTNKDLLLKQIDRHDELINILFGKTPSVFIANSPLGSYKNIEPIISRHKKRIFAYTNFVLNRSTPRIELTSKPHSPKGVLFINTKMSQVFQKIDFHPDKHLLQVYASRVHSRLNKNNPHLYPLIIVYNPIQFNKPFDISQIVLWKTIFKRIHHFYGFKFSLPGEISDQTPENIYETWPADKLADYYRLPDLWLSNKLQRDAWKAQLHIRDLIKNEYNTLLNSNWDFLQDMNNLFFMDDHFLKPSFAARYYSPYSSPYMAYTNYMNILDDMQTRLEKKTVHPIYKPEIRKKKKATTSH